MVWLVILIALMIPLIAVILDSQIGRALAARIEGKHMQPTAELELTKKVNLLEGEVERLNSEVVRLDEETNFLHRLLEGKPEGGALPPGENRH